MRLVVLDYSGTLSIGAVLFGESENLLLALENSGLARLGVNNTDVFWRDIVNPTWSEGSTSSVGYKKIMVKAVRKLGLPSLNEEELKTAADCFVEAYMRDASIDRPWKPLLEKMVGDEETAVLVATDHYAEMTCHIMKHLEELGLEAAAVGGLLKGDACRDILIANSADLGFHKDEKEFWRVLRDLPGFDKVSRVLIVDDFGFNEEAGDVYGEMQRFEKRKGNISSLIAESFDTIVDVLPFIVDKKLLVRKNLTEEAIRSLVEQVTLVIEETLSV